MTEEAAYQQMAEAMVEYLCVVGYPRPYVERIIVGIVYCAWRQAAMNEYRRTHTENWI